MERLITKFSSQSKLERKQPLLNVRFAPECEDVEGCRSEESRKQVDIENHRLIRLGATRSETITDSR